MANKYNDILTITANGKNQMGLSNTIKRDYGIPLDFTSVQENYAKAVEYAATSTLAYVGQPISVGDKLYIITEASQGKYPAEVEEGATQYDIYLTEVGSATEGDGKTIELKDGILSLYGIDGKTSGTYVPTLVNGVLTWNAPDTTTVDGLSAAIEGLETIVGKEAEGDTEATGLIKTVANISSKLDGHVGEYETAVNGLYADVDTLKTDVTTLKTDVSTNKSDIAELKRAVVNISDPTDGILAQAIAAIPTDVSAFTNDAGYLVASDISDKADKATTLAGYGITDAYTKEEVNVAISSMTHMSTKIVEAVPSADEAELGIIYLVADANAEAGSYLEYILVVDGDVRTVELIGSTKTDLSDYAKTADVNTKLESYAKISDVNTELAKKADKDIVTADLAKKLDVETYAAEKATFALENSVVARLADKADKTDFDSYYTKDAADALLTTKADKETVNTGLAKKVETAQIRHTSEGVGEGVTKDGTALTITIDTYRKAEVYTKSETDAAITAKINSVTGGESAADVKLALEDYRDALNTEIWGANAGSWTTRTDADGKTVVVYTPQYGTTSRIDTAEADIATLKTNVEKAQTDATNAGTAVTALKNTEVAANTSAIAGIQAAITGEGGLSARIGALEGANTAHATEYANLKAKVDTAVETTIPAIDARVSVNETAIGTINTTLGTQSDLIATKANAADVYTKTDIDGKVSVINTEIDKKADAATTYTKTEVNTAISTAIGNIDNTAITNNSADIAVLVGNDKDENGRANKTIRAIAADEINTLIKAADPEGGKTIENINNLIAYVDENAGDIAELITVTNTNTAKLAGIDETVVKTIEAKIAAIPGYELKVASAETLGGIKTSTADNGVSVDENGVASVSKVNVNTLTQTTGDVLVLNGGSAQA